MRQVRSSALIQHKTYIDKNSGNNLFLELVYRIWYDDGSIERFHIPRIKLPLSINNPPDITGLVESMPLATIEKEYIKTEGELPILPIGDLPYMIDNNNGESIEAPDTAKTIRVREKEASPVEMTVEQIERELGRKIKIVGGKKYEDGC